MKGANTARMAPMNPRVKKWNGKRTPMEQRSSRKISNSAGTKYPENIGKEKNNTQDSYKTKTSS